MQCACARGVFVGKRMFIFIFRTSAKNRLLLVGVILKIARQNLHSYSTFRLSRSLANAHACTAAVTSLTEIGHMTHVCRNDLQINGLKGSSIDIEQDKALNNVLNRPFGASTGPVVNRKWSALVIQRPATGAG